MTDSTVPRRIQWQAVCRSDVGTVREVNEDAVLDASEHGLWAVADGMGGYHAGDVASEMVVESLQALEPADSLSDCVDEVEDAILDANRRILEYGDIVLQQRTLGSTVVTLVIKGRVGVCLWAGDSRLYRFRNGELLQLSQDHSQVEELVQQGSLSREEADRHPASNVITRAVGVEPELYLDVNTFSTRIGDIFLLCSDGLYNAIDLQARLALFSSGDIEAIADQLLSAALEAGARDNVSLVVLKGMPGSFVSWQAGAQ